MHNLHYTRQHNLNDSFNNLVADLSYPINDVIAELERVKTILKEHLNTQALNLMRHLEDIINKPEAPKPTGGGASSQISQQEIQLWETCRSIEVLNYLKDKESATKINLNAAYEITHQILALPQAKSIEGSPLYTHDIKNYQKELKEAREARFAVRKPI